MKRWLWLVGLAGCYEGLESLRGVVREVDERCAVIVDDNEPSEPIEVEAVDEDTPPDPEPGPPPFVAGDFDGDGVDEVVFAEAGQVAGDFDGDGVDEIVDGDGLVGDFDGDGVDERVPLTEGCLRLSDEPWCFGRGDAEDEYLVGDFDGDGVDDLAVRADGCLAKGLNRDPYADVHHCFGFGDAEDQYVVGDFDGNGVDDVAVRRGYCAFFELDGDAYHDREECFAAEAGTNVLRIDMGGKSKYRNLWLEAEVPQYIAVGGREGIAAVREHEADKPPGTNHRVVFYFDRMNDGWKEGYTAAEWADEIWALALAECGCEAPRWFLLNEISNSRWRDDEAYRKWVVRLARHLKNKVPEGGHGQRKVIVASPRWRNVFEWRGLAEHAWIGAEVYISGTEAKAECGLDFDIDCLAAKYAFSKGRYMGSGVPSDRIFLIEHFGHTKNDQFGRAGIKGTDWARLIEHRAAAARRVGFKGFISYGWGGNDMNVSEERREMYARIYMEQALP